MRTAARSPWCSAPTTRCRTSWRTRRSSTRCADSTAERRRAASGWTPSATTKGSTCRRSGCTRMACARRMARAGCCSRCGTRALRRTIQHVRGGGPPRRRRADAGNARHLLRRPRLAAGGADARGRVRGRAAAGRGLLPAARRRTAHGGGDGPRHMGSIVSSSACTWFLNASHFAPGLPSFSSSSGHFFPLQRMCGTTSSAATSRS